MNDRSQQIKQQRLIKRFISAAIVFLSVGLFSSQLAAQPAAGFSANNKSEAGELIIYRKDKGSRLKKVYFQVFLNGKKLGKLKHKKIYQEKLAPGNYRISSNAGKSQNINITVKAGKASIVKAEIYKKRQYEMHFFTVSKDQLMADLPQ